MKPLPPQLATAANDDWRPVVLASDCAECEGCGEPVCPHCSTHYADCDCPGPHQDDEFEYREIEGRLQARPLPADPTA